MDGRGAGSYVMLGSASSGPSFSVSSSMKLSVAGRSEAGKGGSCMLIPDLVVMAKVGASDVSSRQAYLIGWVVLLTLISFMGSSAVITNQVQVASFLRWKRRSWRVMVHPKYHLGIGHILLFYSILLLQ
ncbi:hypothetical protein Tco_0017473 [Tanacetum coccineum]